MRVKAVPRRLTQDRNTDMALSAAIAHELNNIAVPLKGFIELASETAAPGELYRDSVNEVQIGIDRMGALAYDLESLAQEGSPLTTALVGDCFAGLERGQGDVAPDVWSCDRRTLVKVDVDQVRRAVKLLVKLAPAGPLSVGESVMDAMACGACRKLFGRNAHFVAIRATGIRPAVLASIRSPFNAVHKVRSAQRVTLAAFIHCAHGGGGHVACDGRESLSLVLPAARPRRHSARARRAKM